MSNFVAEKISMKLRQKLLRTEVTCLAVTDDHVISGMGGFVSFLNISSCELVSRINVFPDTKVHGIYKGSKHHFVVFGGREIAVICHDPENNTVIIKTTWQVDGWILCAQWLQDESIAIATAHNTVVLWNWKTQDVMLVADCAEKCILYSCLFVGSTWENLAVLAGTVFQEVIIWAPEKEDSNLLSPVLQRLQGHKGVIFSSHYNPETGRIHTTSDDRSVKGWQVNPHQPHNWQHAEIELLYTLYGHTARVWKSIGLRNCTISVGEDSQICVWNSEGKLLKRWSMHQGGSIWSIACSEQRRILVTGGSDGGINALSLDYCMRNLNPVLQIPLNTNIISQTTEPKIPRRVVILKGGNMVTVLQSGHIMHCAIVLNNIQLDPHESVYETIKGCQDEDCESPTIRSDAIVWTVVYYSKNLVSYCLLEVSPCRQRIALASLDGHLLIFEAEERAECRSDTKLLKIIDMPAVEGKIFSLQWLSSNDILTCEALGKLTLWSLQTSEDMSYHLKRKMLFTLPPCKERWVTAALLVNDFVICGDRAGNIHLYMLSEEMEENVEPCQTLAKVHGRLGVSSLMFHCDQIFSSGRDGSLKQYQILGPEKKISQLCSTRMPFDWASSVCTISNDIIVLGFCEKRFVAWTQQQQRVLFEIPCGGGHRSWDYLVKENLINFAHIKHKCLFLTLCDLRLSLKPFLQTGFHPKEVNCLQILSKNLKFPLLCSAGEDTTIHVTAACEQNKFHTLVVMHSHISSIRALVYSKVSEDKILMFSAGGRAQIKAWELTVEENIENLPKILCQELSSHMLMDDSLRQSKSWKLLQPNIDPETRYMCLCIIPHNNLIFVAVGCSDGYFRVFHFHEDQRIFQLIGSFDFHRRCILNVAYISPLKVLTMATDGIVAFWDLSTLIQSHLMPGVCTVESECRNIYQTLQPFSYNKLHQSGIDSYDLVSLTKDHILLATGGDDTALVISAYAFLCNPVSVRMDLQWRMESAHVAQITGLAFVDKFLISTSVDQRVFVWEWACDLERRLLMVTKVAEYSSTIADAKGLRAWSVGNSVCICVYGNGVEIIEEHPVQDYVK